MLLTVERLRELLDYDAATGIFTWRKSRRRVKAGDIAGTVGKRGYRRIKIDQCLYAASRLAWLHVFGCWPSKQIDHRNGIRDYNRLLNLRDVSNTENGQNRRNAQRNNKTGMLGVIADGVKYRAQITVYGKNRTLGRFTTAEAAHAAYLDAKRMLHVACTI